MSLFSSMAAMCCGWQELFSVENIDIQRTSPPAAPDSPAFSIPRSSNKALLNNPDFRPHTRGVLPDTAWTPDTTLAVLRVGDVQSKPFSNKRRT